MKMTTDRRDLFYPYRIEFYLVLIIFFSYFSHAFALDISGSALKIMEIFAILVLLAGLSKKIRIEKRYSLPLFLFFVVIPVPAIILNTFTVDLAGYYARFPEMAGSIRGIPLINGTIYYGFSVLIWFFLNTLITSRWVYDNRHGIIKLFMIGGVVVTAYCLYGMFAVRKLGWPDLVPDFIDARSDTPVDQKRVMGFANEPGYFLIVYTWFHLFLLFYFTHLRHIIRLPLLLVSTILMLQTMSSRLAGYVPFMLAGIFLFLKPKQRLNMVLLLIVSTVFVIFFSDVALRLLNVKAHRFHYTFYRKIRRFFTAETNHGSGGMRRFTGKCGIAIFKNHPLIGVGPGNAFFYMWKHEHRVGMRLGGRQKLHATTKPNSIHYQVPAEYGGLGYLLLLYVFVYSIWSMRYVEDRALRYIGRIGIASTFFYGFAFFPITSLYFWILPGFFMNIAYFERKRLSK